MEKITLRAPNISCGHCIMAIKRAVSGLDGVSSVEGDPGIKSVTVVFDPTKVTVAKLEQVMATEGYPVAK